MSRQRALSLRAIAGLALAALAATALVATPAEASTAGGAITRAEVIQRGQSWVNQNVSYSQSSYHTDGNGTYRQDCSGFVSMAWHLTGSASTRTLPNYANQISPSDLRPGDILNYYDVHVVLFVGWNDASAQSFTYFEEQPVPGTVSRTSTIGNTKWRNYKAYRYRDIIDSAPGGASSDVSGVQMAGTGSGMTEVHTLSAASGYQSFSVHAATALGATSPNVWQYEMGANNDLMAVQMNGTGSGRTEVHTLTAASGYQSFSVHAATPLGATSPATWQFLVGSNNDLVAVQLAGTGSGRTEVHTLTAASGYQDFSVHAATPLGATSPATWQFLVGSNNDLVAVQMNGTGSGRTEVHTLTAASGYQSFSVHAATPLGATSPDAWQFLLGPGDDLIAVQTAGTGSGMTEVHTLTAASGYQDFSVHAATPLGPTSPTVWAFN